MINGLNHITISVSNINSSFEFYTEILGFKPIMKAQLSAYLLLSNLWIALQEEKSLDHINKIYSHIALNVNQNDFDTVVKKLITNNVIKWKENETEGDSFYFLDPSGNKFEIHYSNLENRIKYGKVHWKDVEWFV
jgi:catechol 2,3-dioxygenase-like lactoylglutathione lyase family enzyme